MTFDIKETLVKKTYAFQHAVNDMHAGSGSEAVLLKEIDGDLLATAEITF